MLDKIFFVAFYKILEGWIVRLLITFGLWLLAGGNLGVHCHLWGIVRIVAHALAIGIAFTAIITIITIIVFVIIVTFILTEVGEEYKHFRATLVALGVRESKYLKHFTHDFDGWLGNPTRFWNHHTIKEGSHSIEFEVIVILDHPCDLLVDRCIIQFLLLVWVVEPWRVHDVQNSKMFHMKVLCYRFRAFWSLKTTVSEEFHFQPFTDLIR